MNGYLSMVACLGAWAVSASTLAAPAGQTTLSDPAIHFSVAERHYAVLRRGDIEAVVVDNSAVDDEILPGHRAGYSGIASLKHRRRGENLFVPNYAGLNFEHIHDGTVQQRSILFEPRHAPMELRIIDDHTVELHQRPTPHWGLESCQRYALLPDGAIELTIECIATRRAFQNGYIGLFWASYIDRPESLDIHFRGQPTDGDTAAQWIRGVTPAHGRLSTHVAADDQRRFEHDADFPMTLVFNRSNYGYGEPWYYGVSHEMALVQMFRPVDQVRLTQSPSGGGAGNPAWDFQCFISDYKVGKLYRFVMRAMYLPFESREQVAADSAAHRAALGQASADNAGR